jgi:Protein of unknown function (DUF3108)
MTLKTQIRLLTALASSLSFAQTAVPSKQLPAVPSEAQCLALGSVKTPYAFGPGEELTFDLDALGAKAGVMTMRVLPTRNGSLPIEVTAETNTFFSKIRRVRGTGTSYLNPKTLRPSRYFEDAHENDFHRVADVQFLGDKTAKLKSTINGTSSENTLTYGNDVSDVAGAVYLMRQLPLKENQSLCFDVYGIRGIWRVWGKVQPREHVSLPVGEFESFHLIGQAARLDAPHMRRDIHLWVSDDGKRLPLVALGSIDLGVVRATLTSFSRPGDKKTRAENKGNLKW